MNNWVPVAYIGLIAATVATIAFVAYRQRESAALLRDAELAARLRSLADGDVVRLAAVEEFEVSVYRRLFYSSVVGPRVRSAAWALLGAVLAAAGVLALNDEDGITALVVWGVLLAVAVVFLAAALAFAGLAVFSAATTPRVSFTEPDAAADE
ncbi:hypothetical protein [Gordonia zhaorongruii]|uniref:hypothetical protein n=1 Tax=Gordonia zhaorongruii TaxID=2597659 RepID=UPI0010435179|nr:hypothetical protein [Gordonia zhaorongruii]